MKKETRVILAAISFAVLAAFLLSRFRFQVILVRGDSMEPCLHNLQITLIDKGVRNFKQGDVVAIRSEALGEVLVKRIAGLPGETLFVSDGCLNRNGKVDELYQDVRLEQSGILEEALTLDEDEFFVLGDNLAESIDSRDKRIGPLPGEAILGKVMGNTAFMSNEGN